MPNIEEFTAGNIDIRPTEIGVESTAAAGRRMGVYGSQIAQSYEQAGRAVGQIATAAEQYIEHREINTGAKHAADFVVNHNQSWNDFITGKDIDPNDPSRQDQINARINNPQAAKQWRDTQLEPDLAQFQQGFLTQGGRQWADRFVNTYRDHIATKAAADQSSMAGAVVQANIEKTGDALAVATFNDPSSLKTNFDLLRHSIEGSVGSSPTMSPEVSTRISAELAQRHEEKLVQAAIQGSILKGGNWKAIASDPAYAPYIKPAENAQFERMEKTYQKGQQVADKQIQLLNKQIAEADQETAMKKSYAKNVSVDGAGNIRIDPQYIRDMTNIAVSSSAPKSITAANAQIEFALRVQRGELAKVSDPNVERDLFSRIIPKSGQAPTTELDTVAAEGNGTLTHVRGDAARALIKIRDDDRDLAQNPQFTFAKDWAQRVIEGDVGKGKDDYEGKFPGFMIDFMKAYDAKKRAGKLESNDLDVNDEKSLIRQTLKNYMPTLAETIRNNGGGPASLPVYTAPTPTVPTPTVTPAVTLPPLANRVVGQTYNTPSGPKTWTGMGWITPKPAAATPSPAPAVPQASM